MKNENVEVMPVNFGINMISSFISRDKNNLSLQHIPGNCYYLSSGSNRAVPVFFAIPEFLSNNFRNQKLVKECGETHSNTNFGSNPHSEIFNLQKAKLRFFLILRSEDKGILLHQLGEKKVSLLLNSYLRLVKRELIQFGAEDIKYQEDLVIAGFASAQNAISCILKLNNSLNGIADNMVLKMILKQGPFSLGTYEELRTNSYFFYKLNERKPVIDHRVLRIGGDKSLLNLKDVNVIEIGEQKRLSAFLTIIRENWQNPFFNVANLCGKLSSSRSRLYRRCKKLTGASPIRIIKEYRLLRCLCSLRSQKSITEILYDSGFNSPSYFSRCFKKRFGIAPQYYRKHLV